MEPPEIMSPMSRSRWPFTKTFFEPVEQRGDEHPVSSPDDPRVVEACLPEPLGMRRISEAKTADYLFWDARFGVLLIKRHPPFQLPDQSLLCMDWLLLPSDLFVDSLGVADGQVPDFLE